jgi:hypothetical protein
MVTWIDSIWNFCTNQRRPSASNSVELGPPTPKCASAHPRTHPRNSDELPMVVHGEVYIVWRCIALISDRTTVYL